MPSPTKSTRVASVQRTSIVVLPCEKVARPPVSRKRKTTQPSANCESTKTMPVIRNVRANCWSISRPNEVIGSGGRQYFAAKRYSVISVKNRRKTARVTATVVEPAQGFFLRIASAPRILPLGHTRCSPRAWPCFNETRPHSIPSYTPALEFQQAFPPMNVPPRGGLAAREMEAEANPPLRQNKCFR